MSTEALESKVKEALRQQLLARNLTAKVVEATIKPEVKAEEVVVAPICKPGQVLFSKLIGRRLPKELIDFPVSILDTTTVSPELVAFIPTVNKAYNIQMDEAHALIMAWEMNEKVLITGPTGSGKSSLIEHACALTKRPMIRVNMSGDVESSVLFGQLVVEGGATVWKDGPVTEAVRLGGVVLLDEWDVTPPEILFSMQWLFEKNGKLFLKEMPGDSTTKFVVPHQDFRLVCAGNTVGQGDETGRYSGTNVQNNASIDRFQTTIVLDYLEPAHEIKIVNDNCAGLKPGLAEKMVSFANLVRTACKQNNINLTMSPRTLINWGEKTVVFGDIRRALVLAFTNKLRDTDANVVSEFYMKVFGTKLR
ncbi:COG0714 MoxR-like ATPases [uncultured Caudovirales phage]|uniref:COG0714 MoxR-like ATPases n=1 Tax=uncultured Caudovirales phage TaxID=2100421 RepID=A0A6J7X8Q4_9CAUD|nr:COG0714 MoxR-like ATPases [uncultured Caudovirales phage]CAB4183257.1 COG0714 MoxR-like ATPases [uncultured Caudovirales phage]CAB4197667.1 COG0714 MoxR-like ATPases [uncultured Caudovirales phage]CAB4212637.1 COG0714 MoxR-like ATPases [uncultured Caudovirales phage]CAB5227234.1 COG0714 MoxR-like ATPases [uncultured Caudovirales phage]